jgi:trehalose-6-phosphate hydrolase
VNDAGPSTTWWKESVFYQIYMPSFCDSNGDGYSDFKGMTSKLDYLKALGIKAIWLTPFLKSPKVDNGYDVASYTETDTIYGDLQDFKIFLAAAHHLGIRVIMDMVLNHTSTEHNWFLESKKSKSNPYREFYIWKDEPNNWESFFGGSAWEFDPSTGQYYYHKFDRQMADLNWTNPKVANAIEEVLKFWLELGIDGFRFDVINFLTTENIWTDNPYENGKQVHLHDMDQGGVKEKIKFIKSIVNQYADRFTVGEVGSENLDVLSSYQSEDLLDVVFNFNFGSISAFSVEKIFNELKAMDEKMNGYPTLFFSSHDMPRMIDRLANGKKNRAIALAALILTAKGVPFIYYGEETGMRNIHATGPDEIIDIQGRTQYQLAIGKGMPAEEAIMVGNTHNRDKSRSPMQWSDKAYAGFSSGKPWIKVNDDYHIVNVANQSQDPDSIWNSYHSLIALRNNERVLQYGDYHRLERIEDQLWFTRQFMHEAITIIVNFGEETAINIPPEAQILMGELPLRSDHFIIYKITVV